MALPLSPEPNLIAMVLNLRLLPQSNLDLFREESQETELRKRERERERPITVYSSDNVPCCVMLWVLLRKVFLPCCLW